MEVPNESKKSRDGCAVRGELFSVSDSSARIALDPAVNGDVCRAWIKHPCRRQVNPDQCKMAVDHVLAPTTAALQWP